MHRFVFVVFVAMCTAFVWSCSSNKDLAPKKSLGSTTLFQAAEAPDGGPKIDALLAQGEDIDAKDADGMTALHHAVAAGNADTVKRLLQAGADTSIQDAKGETALQLAQEKGNAAVLQMFDKYQ